MSNPQGLLNYNKLNDRDKSYIIKLSGTIIASILYGSLSASAFANGDLSSITMGRLGFLTWFLSTLGLAIFIKLKYNLSDMTDVQLFRHGVLVGFFCYLFFWTIFFNVVACNIDSGICTGPVPS